MTSRIVRCILPALALIDGISQLPPLDRKGGPPRTHVRSVSPKSLVGRNTVSRFVVENPRRRRQLIRSAEQVESAIKCWKEKGYVADTYWATTLIPTTASQAAAFDIIPPNDRVAVVMAYLDSLSEWLVSELLGTAHGRLAVYGTLAPGEVNHFVIRNIEGRWRDGFVTGTKRMRGGLPMFRRRGRSQVQVKILETLNLVRHWPRIDKFEGANYRRILLPVQLPCRTFVVANLYEWRGPLESNPSDFEGIALR